jgi:hypothetical protein
MSVKVYGRQNVDGCGPSYMTLSGFEEDNWQDMPLGPLPVAAILKCLGLALKPGEVMFYAHAQQHTFTGRPERHICIPHLERVIASPTHIGQQPGYEADSFDLVCVVPDGPIVLVGISMRIKKGIYPMKSTYPLKVGTLQNRVKFGTTKSI